MKKMQALMVGILTIVLSFCCFASCALLKAGKYEAVSYKLGPISVDVSSDDASYIELKMDNTANASIKIASVTIEGTGTWEEKEGDSITLTIEGKEYSATVKGGELVLSLVVGTITFKK